MNENKLFEAAQEAKGRAYCRYSGYAVGAAVLGEDGKVYTGCNVENISYGLTACAERNAVAAMVRAGCLGIREVVVSTRDGGTPCGACRQVLMEFASAPEEVSVTLLADSGAMVRTSLAELLPGAFRILEHPGAS